MRVLYLTFNHEMANAVRERFGALLSSTVDVYTMHALALRMLRTVAEATGETVQVDPDKLFHVWFADCQRSGRTPTFEDWQRTQRRVNMARCRPFSCATEDGRCQPGARTGQERTQRPGACLHAT